METVLLIITATLSFGTFVLTYFHIETAKQFPDTMRKMIEDEILYQMEEKENNNR